MEGQETSSTEASWKSVLIGSKKKNKTGTKPRFLDNDRRWDAWIPPQPIELIKSLITTPPELFYDSWQKGSWDWWDAWSLPNPVESTTEQSSYLVYMEEKLRNQQQKQRASKVQLQDVRYRRYYVEQVDRWEQQHDGTSAPVEATTGEISSNLYRASVCDMKKGFFLLIS